MEDRSKYGGYHHTCIGLGKDGPTRKSWHKDWTTRRGLDTERTDVKGKYILKSPYIPQDSHTCQEVGQIGPKKILLAVKISGTIQYSSDGRLGLYSLYVRREDQAQIQVQTSF